MTKDVKRRKVKGMAQIDDYFERIIRQVLLKKAEVKLIVNFEIFGNID